MWSFFSVFFPCLFFFCYTRKQGDGLFLKTCEEVSKLYPKIKFEGMIVDNTCMQVCKKKGIILLLILASGVDQEEMCRECTPSPSDHLWISYITSTVEKKEKKTSVIYWCWSKTWDKVKEFELNVKLPIWHGSFEY